MDKIIGKIVNELKAQGMAENTLIMFVGDNGTHPSLVTETVMDQSRELKVILLHMGFMYQWLLIGSKIKNPQSYSGLINLSDFYATFSDILGVIDDSDGTSMMDIFSGKETVKKKPQPFTMIRCGVKMSANIEIFFLKIADINYIKTEAFLICKMMF